MFCPKCGTNVDNGFNFCFKCGFDFSVMKAQVVNDAKKDKNDGAFGNIGVCVKDFLKEGEVKAGKILKDTNRAINKTTTSLKMRYEFLQFDGSQECFEQIYCSLCYEKQDFEKLNAFKKYIKDEYPNISLAFKESLIDDVEIIYIGKNVELYGIIDAYNKFSTDVEFVEDVVRNIITVINASYYYKLIGERNYKFSMLNYTSTINNKYEGLAYMDGLNEALAVNNIVDDAKKYITAYNELGSNVYSKILDNAIKLHNANYLSSLYPTKEQSAVVANLILNEISNSYKSAERNINNMIIKSQEYNNYLKICNELHKDDDNWLGLIADGAINGLQIGVLFAANPILGGVKALQYGKHLYDKDKKEGRRNKEVVEHLDNSISEFIDEYARCAECLSLSYLGCYSNLENNIGRKYLLPAINSIFDALRANGVKVLPLRKYLE